VWNAARFVLMNMEGARTDGTMKTAARLEDRWILSRLAEVREQVSADLDAYRFNEAATALYRFVWNDFCDWYLEIVKPRLLAKDDASAAAARGTLARVLWDSLALLHPFTPYMTEVLWGALHETLGSRAPMLMNAKWPDGAGLARDEGAEGEMQIIQDLVRAVRQVRNLTMIGERERLVALVAAQRASERKVLEAHAETVRGLKKRADKVRAGIAGIDAKLANKNFVERADPDVVTEERGRKAELALELELLERNVAGF